MVNTSITLLQIMSQQGDFEKVSRALLGHCMANGIEGFPFTLHRLRVGLIDWTLRDLSMSSILGAIMVVVNESGCLRILREQGAG